MNNMYFDDILITDNDSVSDEWTEKTWVLKKKSIAAESVSDKHTFADLYDAVLAIDKKLNFH